MISIGHRLWISVALLAMATASGAASEPRSLSHQDGWDRVGSVAAQAASNAHGPSQPATALDRHQARKRAMVRRMLLLMMAHR